MGDGGFVSSVVLIVLLLLVIFAAYFTTRFLSSRTRSLTRCKHMQVKDRMFLGRDKYILLLEAGGKVFLVGVTGQAIQLLGTLDKDELAPLSEDGKSASVFSGLKGWAGRLSGFFKNAGGAQQAFKEARMQAKRGRKREAQEDGIEKIMQALDERRERFSRPDGRKDGK